MPLRYSRISLKEEQTPERLGISTLAVTTSDRTHPTFIPRFSPYYWPDTPTKPPRDRSFPRPLKRQHAKLFVRQSGLPEAELPRVEGTTLSPKSLWLILIYLIDFEFGPQLLLPHFSPIQDVDGIYYAHSLGSSKSKIGFIVLGFCEFQPRLDNQKSYFEQLLSLDASGAGGTPVDDFVRLFSRCSDCQLVVARGAMESHKCLGSLEEVRLASSLNPITLVARLESWEGSGVTKEAMQHLYVQCNICSGFLTKRGASSHECV
jgi:hypothetical protein